MEYYDDYGQAGQPLSRQMSRSLNTVQALTNYQYSEFFRQNSTREEGWMEARIGHAREWLKLWFILDNGVLKYGSSPTTSDEDLLQIPMDSVVTLCADKSGKESTIRITTLEHKIALKLKGPDEMRRWLFAFQKSVALVLSGLMNSSPKGGHDNQELSPGFKDNSSGEERWQHWKAQDEKAWLRVLGHGHGKHGTFNANKKRHSGINRNILFDQRATSAKGDFGGQDNGEMNSRTSEGRKSVTAEDVYMAFRDSEASQRTTSKCGHLFGMVDDSTAVKPQAPIPVEFGHVALPSDTSMTQVNVDASGIDWFGKRHASADDAPPPFFSAEVVTYGELQLEGKSAAIQIPTANPTAGSQRASPSALNSHSFGSSVGGLTPAVNSVGMPHGYDPLMMSGLSDMGGSGIASGTDTKLATSYQDSPGNFPSLTKLLQSSGNTPRSVRSERSFNSASDGDEANSLCNSDNDSHDMMFAMDVAESEDVAHTAEQFVSPIDSTSSGNLKSTSTDSPQRNSSISISTPIAIAPSPPSKSNRSSLTATNRSDYLMWECGYCSKKGPRNSNEDRYECLPNISDLILAAAAASHSPPYSSKNEPQADQSFVLSSSANGIASPMMLGGGVEGAGGYFAVYDGHCGDQAAEFLQENLLNFVLRHPKFHVNLVQAVSETCVAIDKAYLQICEEKRQYSGSTAIGAFIVGSKLLVYNIGDCQAVLCTGGAAVEVSSPHKPGREDEVARIEKAGGWITTEEELYMGRLHRMDLSDPIVRDKAKGVTWVTIHRVCGELAVSRSIGDPDYKGFIPGEVVNAFFSWPEGHSEIFMGDLVIPDPECVEWNVSPLDEFLVLACDGIWDVVSTKEAVEFIRKGFADGKTPNVVADDLCDLALKLGSSDNVTIVITKFIHPQS